ncbi:MAG: tandem-95 repeat protein [Bacteroidetes bacterium]|nr:tandem-95 repeat protein [Bacteroidota bacterium]
MKLKFSPKLFFLVLAVFSAFALQAQVVRPFEVYYKNNQKGGIVYISNVSVSCGNLAGCAAAENELAPAGTTQNNDFIQSYVDVDADGTTFMSSSDSLNLPACSNITYAGLFWGGSVNNATPNFANRNKIKISANGSAYVELDADSLVSNNSGSITYHCYKNITSLAQGFGRFARYTIADLVTQTGTANRFGGWTLVVAYRNDLESLKNLTVFGGVANISTTFTPVQIDLTGFLTPPTGPVTLEMGVVAYDGDRGFVQDSLYFNGAGTYISVNDALNPTRDIFNSTIENKGVENPFRVPLLHNTMGWDADIFAPDNSSKNFIGNNATFASLRLTTGNENYYAQVVTTAIDVYEPDIRIGNTTVDINGAPLNPGDTLEYTVTIQNLGSDVSINSILIDTIPFNLDYVPNSIKIVAGPNQGNKSDIAGDDQAEFDAVGNRVVVRVGTGADAVNGGAIIDNPTGADSSTFKFRATVTEECIKLRCSGFVNSIAAGVGTGQLSGNTQANYSNPSIFDGSGCPIPGYTSTVINLPPSCSLPPDTAFSSCPPFLFSSLATALPGYVYYNSGFSPVAVATSSATYFGIKTLTLGCTDTIALNITIFPSPAFTSVTKTDPVCGAPTSGKFVLNGINPNDSIAFTIGNAHNNASPYVVVSSIVPANTFQNLTSGAYTIRLKNATSCTLDQTIILAPAANCAPTAVDDVFSTGEDNPLSADVSTNDSDLNGDPLTYSIVTNPTNGAVLMNANGTFTYTPNLNYNGPDSFTYKVCDNGAPSLCDTGLVTITVNPVNDSPIAVDDIETTDEDIFLSSTVATNDSDLEGNTLEFAILFNPLNGLLLLNTDGSYDYIPNPNFNGSDSFTYTVCDDGIPSLCDTGIVTITVNAVNDAPLAVDDSFLTGLNILVNGDVSPNDSDIDGDQLTFSVVSNPANGIVLFAPDGSFTYTPNLGFTGNDTITYQVCDNGIPSLCDTAIVVIGVNTTNLSPIAIDDAAQTDEDTFLSGDIAANDFDPNTDPIVFSVLTSASNGTVAMTFNGVFSYTPNLNFNGTDSFTYLVCDNGIPSLCDTGLVTITVNPINDAPVAIDDAIFGGFNLPVSGNASANDFDVDGDPLTFNLISGPDSGIVIFNNDGTFTYTPNNNFIGNDTLVYSVCDNALPSLCDTAIVVIGVNTTNLAPIAVNDTNLNTDEDTALNGDVSTNDSDPNGDPLTFALFSNAANGNVVLNSDGTFTYTPNLNFNGTDTFIYTVCDNGIPALCANATVSITVNPVNDAPLAVDDVNFTPINLAVNGDVSTNDSDIDGGDTLSFTILINGANGAALMNANGQYTYTPNNNFVGNDTLTYVVCDNGVPSLCDTAIVVIGVNVINNAPTALNDTLTVNEDNILASSVATNDSDVNGNILTFNLLTSSTHSSSLIMGTDGSFSYVPNPNYNGPDSFTYVVCDNGSPSLCDTATVFITVLPINDAPLAINDTNSTVIPLPVSGDVSVNDSDIDGDVLTYTILTNGSIGTAILNANGTYTYTPNGTVGNDVITYVVCDNGTPSLCDTAQLVISVSSLIAPPTAVDDAFTTNEDTPLTADVSTNDLTNGSTVLYSALVQPAHGVLVFNNNGTFTYTPATNYNGPDSFSYLICDNGLPITCDTGLVNITVTPVNDAPVAVDDLSSTNQNVAVNGDVSPNDSDVDGDPLSFSVIINPLHGTLTFNTNGSFVYTPATGFSGNDTLTYTVCDNGTPALCDTAIVVFNVIQVVVINQAPIAIDDTFSTNEDTPLNTDVSLNDSDPNGDALSFSVLNTTLNGTLTLNANGTFTYTPNLNFNGSDSFTYEVCDNGVPTLCDTAVVSITVVAVNDAPIANDDSFVTNFNTPIAAIVTANDSDVDGDPLTYTIVNLPSSGTLTFNSNGSFNYVPNAGFTGNDTFVYSACDNAGTPLCDQATVTITVIADVPFALIGIAKSVAPPVLQTNGSFAVVYKVVVKNYGTSAASFVQVTDDLSATFPAPATFTVSSLQATNLLTNSLYNGSTNTNLLEPQTNTLAAGGVDTLRLTLLVNPNGAIGPFNNSAIGSALSSLPDSSVNGLNPDPDGNGNPNESGATPLSFSSKTQIGLSKIASVSDIKSDGTFDVTYSFDVQNMGTVPLTSIDIIDNLSVTFPSPVTFSVSSISAGGGLVTNNNYTGTGSNINILNPQASSIAPGVTSTVVLKINVNTNGTSGTFLNSADAHGTGPNGNLSKDKSNNGHIDNDLNGNPSDQGEDIATPVTLNGIVDVTPVELFIPQGFTPDGDAQNENFVIRGLSNYPDNRLTIYNRWGNIVYQKTAYDNSWNGLSDKGDGKVTQGTYYYVLELSADDLEPRKGYVVIEY